MQNRRFAQVMGLGLASVAVAPLAFAAPYSSAELRTVETQDEAKIRDFREQEVTQLRIALGRRSPTNRRADLYLRLAEIYIEAYRADYLLEGRVHENRLERGQSDKFIDHSRSKPYLGLGVKACKEILNFGIRFDKMDQVYYFLGFNYSEMGDRKEGLKYFDQLTRKFPASPYVAEAYKELGDAAYENGDFRRAQGYLELAVRRSPADSLPRLQHKLAWSYYRTKQFGRAVETMKQAVTSAQKSGEKFLNLREEALRDMAVFMTETGQVDEALVYFQGVVNDKQFYPRVLEKLGRQYERNVQPAKATQVYESLLKTNPDSEESFRVRVKLVDLDLRRAQYREALARLGAAKVPSGGDNETQVAAQNLRAMIRRTATEHHEKFRKNGAKPSLEVAESYYTAYLNAFLGAEDPRNETPEIRMYLAEVKRELGKSREASDLYRKVLESKDKRYAKEAGALWTASLSEAIRGGAKSGALSGKSPDPSPLELEFVDAADRLQDALGDTNDGRQSALKAAEVLAGYANTRKDSLNRIQRIIARWPSSTQAVMASRLWLQLKNDADPEELRETMLALNSNAVLMKADQASGGKLKAQLIDLEIRLKIGVIAKNEKNNDYAAAAANYEAFAHENKQTDIADKSYSNAVANYIKVEDAVSIERVAAEWLKRFGKSARVTESLRGAATHFMITGRFDVASRLFGRLGREGGDADSLETAARLSQGNGDQAGAQAAWSKYLESYKTHPHRGDVLLKLARSYDEGRQESLAAATYKNCMKEVPTLEAECATRLGDLYLRNQNVAEAKEMYRKAGAARGVASVSKKTAKKHKSTATAPSVSPYVGYARYRLAEMMEQEARFEPLQMPEEKLKRAINQRLGFFEPLNRAYMSVVEAGGPWSIAALERLASFAMRFADEVDRIELPPGTDPAAVAQYRKSFASVSGPLRQKALGTWSDGYAKAVAAEALSPAVSVMADGLADAKAPRPLRAQGWRGGFRLAGIATNGDMITVRDKLLKNSQDAAAWVDYGNILWGEGKPLLARIAYERAAAINPRNPGAINNRGVVLVSGENQEDWFSAAEASAFFSEALRQDEFFLAAKMNRASLLNYYRLFEKAKPLWDQVLVKVAGTEAQKEAQDGLGISLQGMGQLAAAEASFAKASAAGASSSRFVRVFHEAARKATQGRAGMDDCLSELGDLEEKDLAGFEKTAVDRLRKACK